MKPDNLFGKYKFYGDEVAVPRRDGYWTSSGATVDTAEELLVMKTWLGEDGNYYNACLIW